MALLSELVTICEQHGVDTSATLTVFARRLREAGRVSKAGRGRGAAHMTFLDAARFLIACAATDHPERATDAEYVFSNTVLSEDASLQGDAFQLDPTTAPTLDQGLAKALEALADGTIYAAQRAKHPERAALIGSAIEARLPSAIWLLVRRGTVAARLKVLDADYAFQHPAIAAVVAAPTYDAQLPLIQSIDREMHRFRNGKNLVAELDANLLRAVANLVAGKSENTAIPATD